MNLERQHITHLVFLSFLSRTFIYLFAYWSSSSLPLFDASPNLVLISRWSKPLLRWDVFHFAHIAEHGYVYEHEWAFFPGLPLLMSLFKNWDMLLAASMVAIACDTTIVLYRLTLHHFGSSNLAFLTALLSLLSSSPATLRLAPYAEPFFTYFSYRGMLFCAQSKWFFATICFCLANTFRSNGILLSGFILWGLLVDPLIKTTRLPMRLSVYVKSIAYTAMIFAPFIYHQTTGYLAFCTGSDHKHIHTAGPSWCSQSLPLIYSHVQSTYWNVGLLRYWTLAQFPNFIIAAPPFIVMIAYSVHILRKWMRGDASQSEVALIPHTIHACVLCCMLLFNSHVQIVLRLAPSMPLIYWAAAWLVMDHATAARWWVCWSIIWGSLSSLLWSTFLPPA
ncbi:glycosyltransferase family 76 protein [Lentinula aff. detonsa]|uniref:GPI mannosyltransferase 2 n=1 Tax=Lentinula aff. detonsa TaxID=2804958 RepID=A0AA38NLD1_9AGAR|nr:glycosyltransferase family 76 protein [Lentinula aff. detonsa]